MSARSRARGQAPATTGWTGKSIVAALGLGLLGSMCGGAAALIIPDGGLFTGDRAHRALHGDTAASLRDAIALQGGENDDVVALAHALLWREHLDGDEHRTAAEKLLKRAAPTRVTPEALYARALLVEGGGTDDALDADLKVASASPWAQLARASRARDPLEHLRLLEQSATTASPLPHATHRWARAAAEAGDLPMARAALERLAALAPGHLGGMITAVVVGLAEEARLPENRRRKPDQEFPAEARLTAASGLDASDAALRDLVIVAFAAGRGREAPAEARARVLEAARTSPGFARAALELALADGDAAFARSIVETQKSIERLDLLVAVSRQRFLAALPEAEVRAASKEPRRITGDGVELPFGHLRFAVEAPGLPWTVALSAGFYPERRYQRLLADVAAGGRRERLDQRLQAIEQLGLAERALARGDIDGAATFVTTAQARAGLDPEVSLVEAAVLARRGDRRGAETAIDTAVASAAQDPELLVTAARVALEVDHLGGARRALSAFRKLGLKSALAASLEATVEARGGDLASARSAIAEAARLGGADEPMALHATILVHRLNDPDQARAAASRLLERGGGDAGGDIVAAWVADADRRKGEAGRAELTLQAITRNRPQLGEGWLFYAQAIDYNPQRKAEALAAATTAVGRLAGPMQAEARRYILDHKNPKKKRR